MKVRCPALSALTFALLLAGCATPVIEVAPEFKLSANKVDMSTALAHLEATRRQYDQAKRQQIENERSLFNVLLGTGVATTGAAMAGLHRDAIAGPAAFGGALLLFGQANMPRSRVLIYQAGVEALNCAERATLPFMISSEQRSSIGAVMNALPALKAKLHSALREAPSKIGTDEHAKAALAELEKRVQAALGRSDALQQSAREFLAGGERAGRELVLAVRGITTAVEKSLISSTPDLSNATQQIAGLTGLMSGFAPGADMGAQAKAAMVVYAGPAAAANARVGGESEAAKAFRAIGEALTDLANAHDELALLLQGRSGAWPIDAFKDCGVAQVITALSAKPSGQSFKSGEVTTRYIDLIGGVKPYFVDWNGPVLAGLSIKPPVRGESSIELRADASLKPGSSQLRVTDSAPSAAVLQLDISVVAAAPTETPASTPAASGAALDVGALIKELALVKKVTIDGKDYDRRGEPRQQADKKILTLTVSCPSAGKVSEKQLGEAWLKAAGLSAAQLGSWKLGWKTDPLDCLLP